MLYEIHRYPADMIDVVHVTRANGVAARVVVRPVLPQDDVLTGAFFARLSAKARHERFLSPVRDVPSGLIARFTNVDYERHLALVAEVFTGGLETVVAEARFVRSADGASAEFAVTVADEWQGLGLASRLLDTLMRRAQDAGVAVLRGETLATNAAMLHLARKAQFVLRSDPDVRGLVQLERVLAPSLSPAPTCASIAS